MDVLVRSVADVNERIEAVVASGSPDGIGMEPDDVVVECARRYVEAQVKLRERAAARSREDVAKFDEAKNRAKARLREKAKRITTELASSLHREWSAALLAGEFALPDGSRVSWADATAEQHELRADQLEALAAGDMATASIHRQAIEDIRSAGVDRLADLS